MSHSEFEIISRYFDQQGLAFESDSVVLGIGDDGAVLDIPPTQQLVMSMDVLVSGVHFPQGAEAGLIASRALAVNLSDLAAMAAKPFCFTLGLSLPEPNDSWLEEFSKGLIPLAQEYQCPLVGGDTARGPLTISIQVHGLVDRAGAKRRGAAQVGDLVFVTGTLGDAAIALLALDQQSHLGPGFKIEESAWSEPCERFFLERFYQPSPRIDFALAGAQHINACIDISDGLLGDLGHIIKASGVGAELQLENIPYSASAQCCTSMTNRRLAALRGGDDYELCFTASPEKLEALMDCAKKFALPLSHIGEIVEGNDISCFEGEQLLADATGTSFDHFGKEHA